MSKSVAASLQKHTISCFFDRFQSFFSKFLKTVGGGSANHILLLGMYFDCVCVNSVGLNINYFDPVHFFIEKGV